MKKARVAVIALCMALLVLPFAAMQDAPLRIYSGDIAGSAVTETILLQLFWLLAMVIGGKLLMNQALKNVVVQGG